MHYLLSVVSGDRKGLTASILRAALAALAFVYVACLKIYLFPFRIGIRRQSRLPCPVISIGNLTVGGTGKTPMTRLVCDLLTQRGFRPCVLIRGYRGESEFGASVVSTGAKVELTSKQAGDEAYLLARLMPGVPIIAGKDRRKTGALAMERFNPDVIVLDDGMQFYQLHRDLDVVLLNALNPFNNGWTFPRGLLREPTSHLTRAGLIVITNSDKVEQAQLTELKARVAKIAPGVPIETASFQADSLEALDKSANYPVEWLLGRTVASYCALGDPGGFEELLVRSGAEIVSRTRFPDHHEPTMGELDEIIDTACRGGAEAVIVTEKDAVKLPPIGRPLPFLALKGRLAVDHIEEFCTLLIQVIPT
jgi:tetraacyldisaccharide 4'-kinase